MKLPGLSVCLNFLQSRNISRQILSQIQSRWKLIQTTRDSLYVIWREGRQLEAAVLMRFTHPCTCSIGSLYLTAPTAEFHPPWNWRVALSYLPLQCVPRNGAGLGPREEHREESLHTQLLGAVLCSWALTAHPSMTECGLQATAFVVKLSSSSDTSVFVAHGMGNTGKWCLPTHLFLKC